MGTDSKGPSPCFLFLPYKPFRVFRKVVRAFHNSASVPEADKRADRKCISVRACYSNQGVGEDIADVAAEKKWRTAAFVESFLWNQFPIVIHFKTLDSDGSVFICGDYGKHFLSRGIHQNGLFRAGEGREKGSDVKSRGVKVVLISQIAEGAKSSCLSGLLTERSEGIHLGCAFTFKQGSY